MRELPTLVAGGGIGGLAAALGLAAEGRPVRLFEQAPAFEEVGAGLQMSPNGVRALQALGAWDAVAPSCVTPAEIHMRDGRHGRLLQRIPLGKSFEQRYGAPYRVCHRADLLAGLLAVARAAPGVALETGRRVTGVTEVSSAIRLSLADGGMAAGHALVAADGIRSALRAAIAGGIAPVSRGMTLYRALLPLTRLPPGIEADCVTLWLCPGAHVVHYPVSNWKRFNIVVAAEGAVDAAEGWRQPAGSGEVARQVAGSCAALDGLLRAPASFLRWPGMDLPTLPRWHRGRAVLLGDAAHATLPFLAQGAVMALEDAVELSAALRRARPPDAPAAALAAYEAARRPRTARIQQQSRRMGAVYHAGGPLALARNLALGLGSPALALRQLDWIYRWMPEVHG